MKLNLITSACCLLLLCAVSRYAQAEETLAAVQQSFTAQCAASIQKRQDPDSEVNRFCGCLWQAMQDNLSIEEIQQLMLLDTPDKQTFMQAAPVRKILQPWQACTETSHKPAQAAGQSSGQP